MSSAVFPGVSLIISTYNRPDALALVLESVAAQSHLPDEIIIADDGSGSETASLVQDFCQSIPLPVLHSWQEDDGFRLSRSRNLAISRCTQPYIISIDGDIILHPQFIAQHLSRACYSCFLQGSRVLLSPNKTRILLASKRINISFFEAGLTNRLNAVNLPSLGKYFSYKRKDLKAIRGCNMSFWKDDLLQVNGFNEDIVGWGREDSELAARLMNAGVMRINLKLCAIAYHLDHLNNHKENNQSLDTNDHILQNTIIEKKSSCENGLSLHGC